MAGPQSTPNHPPKASLEYNPPDMRSAVLFLVPMAGVTALLVWGLGWSDPIALALVATCSLVLGRVVYRNKHVQPKN